VAKHQVYFLTNFNETMKRRVEKDQDEALLLRIQGNSLLFKTIGYISLYKLSDIIYSIRYEDHERCLSVDIDSVEIKQEKKFLIFEEPTEENKVKRHIFYIPNGNQLAQFAHVQQECQDLTMKYLDITSRLRDVYYSGFYSSFQAPSPNVFISDELNPLQYRTATKFFESIQNGEDSLTPIELPSQVPATNQQQLCFKSQGNVELICFYCSDKNSDQEEDFFFLHPYVPMNYQKSPILMCKNCLENWKVYRDDALYENELILPGEINEEICCLCSDSPQVLTLCASCQRSFCPDCLKKVLKPKEYQTMIEKGESNWKCMCCCSSTPVHPPLTRDAWRLWNQKTLTAGSSSSPMKSPTKHSRNGTPMSRKNNTATTTKSSSGSGKYNYQSNNNNNNSSAHETNSQVDSISPSPSLSSFLQSNISLSSSGRKRKSSLPPDMVFTGFEDRNTNSHSNSNSNNQNNNNNNNVPRKRGKYRTRTKNKDGEMNVKKEEDDDDEDQFEDSEDVSQAIVVKSSLQNLGNGKSEQQSVDSSYFEQYCEMLNQSYQSMIQSLNGRSSNNNSKLKVISEDACYLCKDGGTLLGCDFRCRSSSLQTRPNKRCLKVYHQDCLGFTVPRGLNYWCCPKHFCSTCGEKKLKFVCLFCPISLCKECPSKLLQKVSCCLLLSFPFISFFFVFFF
jgi:hypothetical protein